MKKYGVFYITVVMIMCLGLQTASAAEYNIGVLAKNGATKALKKWSDTARYLNTKMTGDTFHIVPLGFEEVFPAIENGQVDFFLVNSSMYVTAKTNFAADAIATMINSRQNQALTSFGGVIFTYIERDDINSLEDLRGKSFMAVKKSSFGGWQMAYKTLLDKQIDPYKDFAGLHFGNKHDNVVLNVQNGEMDAGTVRTDTLERMEANGDISLSEFKILNPQSNENFPFVYSTALYPEWPFAKAAHVSDSVAAAVASALISMDTGDQAAVSAKIMGWSEPGDYSGVESLQMLLRSNDK